MVRSMGEQAGVTHAPLAKLGLIKPSPSRSVLPRLDEAGEVLAVALFDAHDRHLDR